MWRTGPFWLHTVTRMEKGLVVAVFIVWSWLVLVFWLL